MKDAELERLQKELEDTKRKCNKLMHELPEDERHSAQKMCTPHAVDELAAEKEKSLADIDDSSLSMFVRYIH